MERKDEDVTVEESGTVLFTRSILFRKLDGGGIYSVSYGGFNFIYYMGLGKLVVEI